MWALLLVFVLKTVCLEPGTFIRHREANTSYEKFLEVLNTNCDDGTIKTNLKNLNNSQTNYFLPQSVNNTYLNQSQMYQSQITGNFVVGKQNLKNQTMKYTAFLPKHYPNTSFNSVVCYFHGNIFGLNDAPSNNGQQTQALAALYNSRNMIILFVDYLGYNSTSNYTHPYLTNPDINVKCAIMALNHFFRSKLIFLDVKQIDLHIVGYSEGSNYVMFFQKCSQGENQECRGQILQRVYRIKGLAALDGPLDLGNTMFNYLDQYVNKNKQNKFNINRQAITNFAKAPIAIMELQSYMFYDLGYSTIQRAVHHSFYNMSCQYSLFYSKEKCKIQNKSMNLMQAIKSSAGTSDEIAEAIAFSSFGKHFLAGYPFLSSEEAYPTGFSDGYFNNMARLIDTSFMNQEFLRKLQSKSPMNNQPLANRTFLFSLTEDSIVPRNNSEAYMNKYGKDFNVKLILRQNKQYHVCPNKNNSNQVFQVDHNRNQLVANIYGLAFLLNLR